MKATETTEEGYLEPATAGPAPTTGYRIVGYTGDTTVFVPATGQNYNLANLTNDQAEQLLQAGWPHIQRN